MLSARPPRPLDRIGDPGLLRVDEQDPTVAREGRTGELLEASTERDPILGERERPVLLVEVDHVLVAVAVLTQERTSVGAHGDVVGTVEEAARLEPDVERVIRSFFGSYVQT